MVSVRRVRRRLMAEINVVPYIDVMLVLLVIFMITAPLLTEGVHVEMVQAQSRPIEARDNEPFVVVVDKEGRYFLNDEKDPSDLVRIGNAAAAVLRHRPETQFLVKGDKAVDYGAVVQAMVGLQQAGVASVGLVTRPPEN